MVTIRNYINEFITDFKRKTAHMTKKELIFGYVWEYYKLHIITFLVSVIFIASLIHTIFNRENPAYFSLSFYGEYISDEDMDIVKDLIIANLSVNMEEYSIPAYSFVSTNQDPSIAMAQMERFMALLMLKEIDVLFADKENYEGLIQNGIFCNLNDVFSKEELELLGEAVIYGTANENPELLPYAIDLKAFDSEFLQSSVYFYFDRVVGIAVNSSNIDSSKEALLYILDLK